MLDVLKKKINAYKEAVVGNGIYDVIKSVLGLALGGVGTPTIVNAGFDFLKIDFLAQYRIPIIIICTLAVLVFILEIYTRRHSMVIPEMECPYTILEKSLSFTYGRDCSKYECEMKIRSNVNGLNRIAGKYAWSGSDPASITCATKHCRIIPLARKDSYIEYEVELRKKYNKGSRLECKVVGDMPDSQHTFVPFFSSRITEETKKLIINICIPPEYNVKEIICEEIAIVRNSNEVSEIISLDMDGKYTWEIPKPKLFYIYSVRWEL